MKNSEIMILCAIFFVPAIIFVLCLICIIIDAILFRCAKRKLKDNSKTFLYYKNVGCYFGMHEWYIGSYAWPVWGRCERHCLQCNKKQHRIYKPLGWKTFKTD